MDRGSADYLGFVNSNPKVPLNALISTSKEYLATMRLWATDEVYYEFNNPQYANASTATTTTVLPYQVKFNVSGSINVNALLRSTSSSAASVSLNINKNGTRVASLNTDSTSAVSLTAKITVQKGDILTFDLSSNSRDASAYLSANGLTLLTRVINLSQGNLLEVIE